MNVDITNNRLTFVRKTERRNSSNQILSEFLCQCGNTVFVPASVVKRNNTKSCGCLKRDRATIHALSIHSKAVEAATKAKTTHGMTNTRFYLRYKTMVNRCTREGSSSYEKYGARGITVCERWMKFENFYEDMYESFLDHQAIHGKDTSLERKDGTKGYEPSNCRWATYHEQALNRRKPLLPRRSTLTPMQVINIRHSKGSVGSVTLGRLYGVSKTTIRDIWTGKTWADVEAALEATL